MFYFIAGFLIGVLAGFVLTAAWITFREEKNKHVWYRWHIIGSTIQRQIVIKLKDINAYVNPN